MKNDLENLKKFPRRNICLINGGAYHPVFLRQHRRKREK